MKKVLTIMFFIMLFITIIQFRNTYALYRTKKEDELQISLGVWAVKVNGTDISSGEENMTFEITDEFLHFEDSEYVSGKYIAPGSEGYFDLLIDATDTDVSIKYGVQIADSASLKIGESEYALTAAIPIELISVEEIFIKDEEIDTTTAHINYLDTINKSGFGVIPLSVIDEGYKGKIRIHFKWVHENNDEFDTMLGNDSIGQLLGYSTGNNEVDQALIANDTQPKLVIPVSLRLTQYRGENLTGSVMTINNPPVVATP